MLHTERRKYDENWCHKRSSPDALHIIRHIKGAKTHSFGGDGRRSNEMLFNSLWRIESGGGVRLVERERVEEICLVVVFLGGHVRRRNI